MSRVAQVEILVQALESFIQFTKQSPSRTSTISLTVIFEGSLARLYPPGPDEWSSPDLPL